jgi:hypothetical protein
VSDSLSDEPLLTLDQAYLAAYYFILQYYERDGRKPISMFLLLDSMEMDAPRETSDPASWHDWTLSVARAIELEGFEDFSSSISRPLSE